MNQLEDLFYLIEAGTYQKEDNSFYQNKLQQMSDDGGVIATIRLGLLTDNPFLANVGPKINLKYKTIHTCCVLQWFSPNTSASWLPFGLRCCDSSHL